jgi:hypothetical protein
MPLDMFVDAMAQFKKLGTMSIEFTGGGEPTMWPDFDKAIGDFSINTGVITNGTIEKEYISLASWIRISLNPLDYGVTPRLYERDKDKVSFCYIWNMHSKKTIKNVGAFADEHKIICRVAPDCITTKEQVLLQMDEIKKAIEPYEYLFLSDFNIDLERKNNKCFMHMLKPCLYLDGYVYACPSTELCVENKFQMQEKYRICHYTEIEKYYTHKIEPLEFDCSYCKYVQQNEVIEEVLTETEHNEFC